VDSCTGAWRSWTWIAHMCGGSCHIIVLTYYTWILIQIMLLLFVWSGNIQSSEARLDWLQQFPSWWVWVFWTGYYLVLWKHTHHCVFFLGWKSQVHQFMTDSFGNADFHKKGLSSLHCNTLPSARIRVLLKHHQ
jgi:hypothetical protein